MTLDEAVAELKRAGLEVSAGPDGFSAAADPHQPADVIARQGVRFVYNFGFGARKIGPLWFFHHRGTVGRPSEEFERLEDAVARGLALFAEYRARPGA